MKLFKKAMFLLTMTLVASVISCVSVFAADVSFLAGSPEEAPFLFEDKVSQVNGEDEKHRFVDGSNYIVYKFDLDKTKKSGSVDILISNNYIISVSTDGTTWEKAVADETGIKDHTNKVEESIDISKYISSTAKSIYVKVGDQTTNDGWGGAVWEVNVSYSGTNDNPPASDVPNTAAPTAGATDDDTKTPATSDVGMMLPIALAAISGLTLIAKKNIKK